MKKILLLLCALLGITAGAMAQPDVTGKTFTLQCKRGYVYYDGTVLAGTSDASSASAFAIVNYNEQTYLYDATQKAFVCHSTDAQAGTTGNASLESNKDFSKAVKGLSFGNTSIEAYPYHLADSWGNWLNMDGTPKVYFNTWKNYEGGNGGNTYKVEIVDASFDATEALAMLDAYFNPSATVTYVISDANGVIYTSEPFVAAINETINSLPAELQRPYCTYNVTAKTVVAGSNTVNVTVTYAPPFTVSSSFDDATWYYAKLRGTKYLRADENQKDGSGRYMTSTTNEKTDAYKWAFIGNPYNLAIMNKGAGGTKYLNANNSTAPLMMNATPASDIKARWIISSNSNGGFNVRSESGANLYINDAGGGGNLGFWNSSWASSDNGSNWVIEAVPAAAVDVTYDLYVGGEKVKSVVDPQVAPNSEVAIPSSLISSYSVLAYDFTTAGTIGTENCTINVTATMKSGVVTDLTQLSNAKAYTFNTERGSLGTNGTQMVSTFGTSFSISNFAVISYEGNYYLYSVADSKWVGNPTTINSVASQPALTTDLNGVSALAFDASNATVASPLFFVGYGSNGVNVSNYATGIVVNSWTTRDAGNQYCIIEAADFDATNALAALEEHFHPAAQTQFAEAIAKLKAINFGTGLNQYSFTGEYASYTSQAETIINGLEAQGYTDENLAAAQTLLANYAINLPSAGFYRIKGNTSGMYLAAGNASNGKYAMSDATDATTIFYFDGSILTNLSTGLNNGMNSGSWDWVVGNPSEVTFKDGNTNGGYGILSTNAYFYDNGDGTSSADRGSSASMTDGNLRYRSWQLEAVSSFDFPVTISEAGYATLCAPVALTIPAGVTANTLTLATDGKTLVLSPVGDAIPAGTPVLLEGTQGSYSFATTDGVPAIDAANLLVGTYPAIQAPVDSYVLQNQSGVVGFYQVDNKIPNVRGFRAYLNVPSSSVKAFVFGVADAISSVNVEQSQKDATIFNIAGQRVAKAQKGIYIVNGKKVLVK